MTDRKCGNSHCDSEFVWGASLTILESWENFFISLLIFKFASDLYSIGRISGAVAQASHIAHCNNGTPKFSALRAEDFFRGLHEQCFRVMQTRKKSMVIMARVGLEPMTSRPFLTSIQLVCRSPESSKQHINSLWHFFGEAPEKVRIIID